MPVIIYELLRNWQKAKATTAARNTHHFSLSSFISYYYHSWHINYSPFPIDINEYVFPLIYRQIIPLVILEEGSYEKDVLFYVNLGEPQMVGGKIFAVQIHALRAPYSETFQWNFNCVIHNIENGTQLRKRIKWIKCYGSVRVVTTMLRTGSDLTEQ